jgi:hypothetical protein
MSRRWSLLSLLPLLLAGCLQEGPPPTGIHLFHGQNVEAPGFIRVGDESMVRFEARRAYATSSQGGVSDLWITSFDGVRQRKVVEGRSDAWPEQAYGWSAQDYPSAGAEGVVGERYFMVGEHRIESNTGMSRVASLVRLGSTLDEGLRLDGVASFMRFTVPIGVLIAAAQDGQSCPGFPGLRNNCPQLFLERPVAPGQKFPLLCLWDGTNEFPVGYDSGSFQIQTMGNGNSYFVVEDARILVRLRRPGNTLDSFRANVSRFSVSGDERYVALAVTDEGKSKTVVRVQATGVEVQLMRQNPSGWGGFGNDTFYYAQNATSTAPAEVHALDLITGADTFQVLPKELSNLAGALDRPGTDERLLLDSYGHGVFTSKKDFVGLRSLSGPLLTPSFTPDGDYLIYVDPAAPTLYDTTIRGALMFQDALVKSPASMVSPPGLVTSAQGGASYFFTDGDAGKVLVFWAELGRATSDLYFADYQPGGLPTGLRLVAKAIMSVSISAHSLFGIVNMSQQDGVGDLVFRDLDRGTETLYAHAVSDAAGAGGADLSSSYTAYIVRGRVDSDRSGLWLTTLAPPTTPDGGSN